MLFVCLSSISAANKTLNLDFLIQEAEHASGKSHGKSLTRSCLLYVILIVITSDKNLYCKTYYYTLGPSLQKFSHVEMCTRRT